MTTSFMDKYGSALKYWGNWGFAGLICGWLFMFELPAIRKDGIVREDKAATREDARAEKVEKAREKAADHATDAGMALRELTKAVENNTASFREVQTVTHKNQEKLIEVNALMAKKMKDQE